MQVLEQEDGFRVSSTIFPGIIFLKKCNGWTKQLVQEFDALTSDLWNMAYNLGVTSVDRIDKIERNLNEAARGVR